MSQIGRALEAPRPLKTTIKQQSLPLYQQNFEVNSIEDLISLTETVAQSLNQGDVSFELFNKMFQSLVMHGQQLEIYSKEILDRSFNIFRNASQDDRLKISIRLNLLNLIELRANSWIGNKCADYYKSKAQSESDMELTMLSSSPSAGITTGQSLLPGEIVKNSGKFSKPTKIPGKNYSKDEIVIRNSDSGKVNPGARERLVQITGPNEENINYAKMLIEDTIKRNASPIREASQEGSISSLASSVDDQQISGIRTRAPIQMTQNSNIVQMGNKLTRSSSHHNANYLVHSSSTNDASFGEFMYTVNIGNHSLKITGDSLELVKAAKLVLDDYFNNEEFVKSNEAYSINPEIGFVPIPSQPSPFIDSGVHLDLLARSSSGANVMVQQIINDVDDEVFLYSESPVKNDEINILTSSSSVESSSSSNTVVTEQHMASNGLSRSRRSHFSRKDSTPETANKPKSDGEHRITYSIQSLWWFSKNSPLCKSQPSNLDKIREKCPTIVRDKNQQSDSSVIRYCDVEKFMDLRDRMDKKNMDHKSDDIIEIDDED